MRQTALRGTTTVIGLLLWTLTVAGQDADRTAEASVRMRADQDFNTLVRAQQLQGWLQSPLGLDVALCIQHRWNTNWPSDENQSLSDRQADTLRMVHEACRAAVSGGEESSRFITAGKKEFLERMGRLQQLTLTLERCRSMSQTPAQQVNCLQKVAKRPLSEHERRALLPEQITRAHVP